MPSLTEWHYCKTDIFYHSWRKNCAKARNGLSICPMSSGAYSNTLDWTIQLHVQSWVSRSRTQLQREPSTFGSKNVIWLHSLDKQKSDLTRWTNNRDERQTTDLWVTPTDKGSASLGRNMNAHQQDIGCLDTKDVYYWCFALEQDIQLSMSIVVFNSIRTWKPRYLISPYWLQSLKTKNDEHGPVALTL